MPEKYFAAIIKKTPLSESDYVYVVDSITAGYIDEKTHLLTSTTGEKYKRIDDFSDFEKTTEYYTCVIDAKKITEIFGKHYNFSDAVTKYEKDCKQITYYAFKYNDGYALIPIDKRPYINALTAVKEDPQKFEQGLQPIKEKNSTDKYEEETDYFIKELKDLIVKVATGEFSPDELIDIKEQVEEQKQILDDALEAIDLASQTLENELEEIALRESKINSSQSAVLDIKDEITPINVDDLFDKVTKVLIAQDKPARRIIVELCRLEDMRKKDYGILLTGESGVGKTLLMSLLARYMNKPFLAIDSTQLTSQGYVGKSIEEYLWDLYEDCGKDLNKAEHAIIFFDEIDKKGSEKKSDISGQAVLNMLLKFLDGVTYTASKNPQRQTDDNTVKISTKNMLIVGGGAFLDAYRQDTKRPIGFASTNKQEEAEKKSLEPTINDFVKKSLIPKEFMGRVPVIVRMNNLNVDSIRRILLESEDSALKIQEEVFATHGVKLTTKDGYIISVAQKALEENIGARGLNKLISDTTWVAYDQVVSNPGVYDEVILSDETVANEEKFQLIKKKKQ